MLVGKASTFPPSNSSDLLSVLGSNDRAALVLAALGANGVRPLRLAAVRAGGNARGGQKVVAAALGGALLGVAPFRIRHESPLKLNSRNGLGIGCETLGAANCFKLRSLRSGLIAEGEPGQRIPTRVRRSVTT